MPGIFEGVGIMTITGTAATIGLGLATPADCYVGLAMAPPNGTIKIKEPVGTLGCQYDFGDTRVFAEHISSPSVGNDWPGINHAGVKQLFVNTDLFDVYAGASLAVPSEQLNGDPVLVSAGTEFGEGMLRFYGEYLAPVDNPGDGMAHAGVKFIF